MNPNLNAVSIETELYNYLATLNLVDAKNLWIGARKAVTPTTQTPKMMVVRISGNVLDNFALGEAIVSLDIYVKDTQTGVRNSSELRAIVGVLLQSLPITTLNYKFVYLNSTSPIPDGNGYYYQILNLKTFIKNNI